MVPPVPRQRARLIDQVRGKPPREPATVPFCDSLILKAGHLPCHLISPLRRRHELRSAARIGGLDQRLKNPGDRNIYPVLQT
jgi:hypothetical protein